MATINAYQIDLLKPYLNTKEMNFIENIDVESQKLNQMLTKETEHRDIMANFIDHLKDAISRLEDDQSNEEFLGVLAEVQDIFQKSNENIESTQNLILLFNTIYEKVKHDSIMPISNASEARITVNAVMQFKDVLNEFMTKNEEVKSKLFLSNIKFDTFWQRSNIKEYVAIFEKNANSSFSQKGRNHLRNQEKVTIPNIENIEENHTLLISEKLNKVFLPFTKQEISLYLEQYPNDFRSLADVIKKEFILSLDYYMKFPVLARFREAYSLIRDRESKSIIDAFKFAIDVMFHYEINPVIIAACKTQEQFERYLDCMKRNHLEEFTDFEIKFEVSPVA